MGVKRLVAIAVSLAVLAVPGSLWAQRGGGGHSVGGGGRSFTGGHSFSAGPAAGVSHGFSSFHSSPSPVYRPSAGSFRFTGRRPGVGGGRRGPGGGRYPGRGYANRFYGGYGYPYANGYGFYPYGSYIPSSLSYAGFPEDYQGGGAGGGEAPPEDYGPPESGYGPGDQLEGQVQQLSDEVAQLREGQGGYGPPPAAAPSEPMLPTVLVYRDGRQMEVQNYAIYGQAVWVFGNQITRKIAFADLDLANTKKLNDQRGVEFDIPESR